VPPRLALLGVTAVDAEWLDYTGEFSDFG